MHDKIEMTLTDIEKLAENHATCLNQLLELINQVDEEIREIHQKYQTQIREAAAKHVLTHGALTLSIDENRNLFDKPKTRTMHGIKLGLQKKKGSMVIEDEEKTVKYIEKHYDDPEGVLIETVKKLNKTALGKLPNTDLKKMGISTTSAGDHVFVKFADSDLEKLVNSLLSDLEVA